MRERVEDIPLLTRHFVDRFAARLNKDIRYIPDSFIQLLRLHSWPGNIRELQNPLECAVILSEGPELSLPHEQFRPLQVSPAPSVARTLAEAGREHIGEFSASLLSVVPWRPAGEICGSMTYFSGK